MSFPSPAKIRALKAEESELQKTWRLLSSGPLAKHRRVRTLVELRISEIHRLFLSVPPHSWPSSSYLAEGNRA